jgi:hypothetical protein
MGRAGNTALARKETKIREAVKQWQEKGTFGIFLNVFKRVCPAWCGWPKMAS